ncbi:MAG: inositol monophosphatase [SAR202 cluster bacterium]|nr:inositol monophosphatase [SAR202 cluster bacterium]
MLDLVGKNGKDVLEVAKEVALEAGDLLMRRFRSVLEINYKGRGNIVTDVDKEAQDLIQRSLFAEFPEIRFVGEESENPNISNGLCWIVDPIDGTRNFASGIPIFSIVIGLISDSNTIVGVNYDPIRNDMFEAKLGSGTRLNGKLMQVSAQTKISECIIGMDMSYSNQGGANSLDVVKSIWPGMQTLRIMGSSALGLSYVSSGMIDLYFNHQLSAWDQVAGILLVNEAGGYVIDRNNQQAQVKSDGIIASNRELLSEFMELTKGMNWRKQSK